MNPKHPDDERIDTILAALRDAEPSADLQQRLHAALHEAEDQEVRTRASRWYRLSAMPLPALAVVLVGVLVGATVWMLHHTGHSQANRNDVRLHVHPDGMHAKPNPPVIADASQSETAKAVQPATLHLHTEVARVTHGQVRQLPDDERNIPAPPMPLTRQETLLLQMARHNRPQQLATLVADARESSFQREKEQVREFFQPLPPIDQSETSTDTNGENR